MSEMTRVKDVVETVIADDHFADVGKMIETCTEMKMSKAATKAFHKAKKMSELENARARRIVSALRAKREGITEAITEPTTEEHTTSTSGQASIFDFLVDKMGDGGRIENIL